MLLSKFILVISLVIQLVFGVGEPNKFTIDHQDDQFNDIGGITIIEEETGAISMVNNKFIEYDKVLEFYGEDWEDSFIMVFYTNDLQDIKIIAEPPTTN